MASPETFISATSDGLLQLNGQDNWAAARDGTTAGTISTSSSTADCYGEQGTSGVYSVSRIFYVFDTSALPNDCTITAATLNLYCTSANGGGITVHAVQTSQSDPTNLVVADFNNLSFTSGGSVAVTTTGAKTIDLNATGLTWINKTGNTLIGVIDARDQSNSSPSVGFIYDTFNMSEAASNKPSLTVTYTLPSGGNFFSVL